MLKKCMFSLLLATLVFNSASGMLKKKFCLFNCVHEEEENPIEVVKSKEERNSDILHGHLKDILDYVTSKNINGKDYEDGNTLLHLSIFYGFDDIAEMLLDKEGIDVTVKNNNNVTPIFMALMYSNTKIAAKISKKFPDKTTIEQLEEDYQNIKIPPDENLILSIRMGLRFIKNVQNQPFIKPRPGTYD